jgi:hypothetical protein
MSLCTHGRPLVAYATYDRPPLRPQKIINKLILIIQDAVRCYREIYEEKKKQTVQTKLSMFLIKKTSTSTQEHDPVMYCTVSLSKI